MTKTANDSGSKSTNRGKMGVYSSLITDRTRKLTKTAKDKVSGGNKKKASKSGQKTTI